MWKAHQVRKLQKLLAVSFPWMSPEAVLSRIGTDTAEMAPAYAIYILKKWEHYKVDAEMLLESSS